MLQETQQMARFRSRLKQVMLDHAAKVGEPMSQRKLADELKISLTTVTRWYHDDEIKSLDVDTLVKFMDRFNVKFDELVEIER